MNASVTSSSVVVPHYQGAHRDRHYLFFLMLYSQSKEKSEAEDCKGKWLSLAPGYIIT